MASPVDDRGVDAFLTLLQEGAKGSAGKTEALEALSLRPVWLATWEPRAEGFRTLINADGEEALAVFSSEDELKVTATQFAVYCDIEKRDISQIALQFEPRSDCPDLPR